MDFSSSPHQLHHPVHLFPIRVAARPAVMEYIIVRSFRAVGAGIEQAAIPAQLVAVGMEHRLSPAIVDVQVVCLFPDDVHIKTLVVHIVVRGKYVWNKNMTVIIVV